MMPVSDKSVSDTILQQLGGGRFMAMTGAYLFVYGPRMLRFTVPRVGVVTITLEDSDLYTVQFWRHERVVKTFDFVYADRLRDVFESHTGLRTSL